MEKYKEIYDYLKTFPTFMTVGTLISNIEKAENEFLNQNSTYLKLKKEEYVGYTFYYEEKDDDEIVCKYITYVKEPVRKNGDDNSFVCDLIAITNCDIHYEEDATVDVEALKMARKVSKDVFYIAKEKFSDLRSFSI